MRRRKPLRAKTSLRSKVSNPLRRGTLKKVNKEWRAQNHARAYGEKAAWIRWQGCCVPGCCRSPVVAAHTKSGGMGRKSGSDTLVPLCATSQVTRTGGWSDRLTEGHHEESHRGVKTFEAKYGFSLHDAATGYEQRWQAQR